MEVEAQKGESPEEEGCGRDLPWELAVRVLAVRRGKGPLHRPRESVLEESRN